MLDYKFILDNYKKAVESRIYYFISKAEPQLMYEPILYTFEGGGKRIRPILSMLACESVGEDPLHATDVGVAIEILHNFTLVHDDIMDNSPLRRGKPTVHRQWNTPVAILAGDAMIGIALKALHTYSNQTNFGKIIDEFADALIEVCEGQTLDMEFNELTNVTEDMYIKMIEKKTAKVIQSSLALGGICAGAIETDIQLLRDFGYWFGLAFQLQDDLLDMIAEEKKFGKRIGNDIIEKKKTLLIILAKEEAKDKDDIELISKIFSDEPIEPNLIPKFDEMFKRLNIYEKIKKLIRKYIEKAIEVLDELPQNNGTKMLEYFARKVNERVF